MIESTLYPFFPNLLLLELWHYESGIGVMFLISPSIHPIANYQDLSLTNGTNL